MARGTDKDTETLPPRKNPFRQEITNTSSDHYQQRREEIKEQLADKVLRDRVEAFSKEVEEMLQNSFTDYQKEAGDAYVILGESETGTLLNIQRVEQNYAAFLSEKLLEKIEDPYLQNRLDNVISEYQNQILKPLSLTRFGSNFNIEERIFNRFVQRVQREILLYELQQNSLEREEMRVKRVTRDL